MQHISPDSCRASTLLAAVIYMMTVYQRHRCPGLASSIAAHLDCLSQHPGVDRVIREVAQGMHDEWHHKTGGTDAAVAVPQSVMLN